MNAEDRLRESHAATGLPVMTAGRVGKRIRSARPRRAKLTLKKRQRPAREWN